MSTAFKNPPVNEVVVATYFNPPLSAFHSEHIGLFWEKIKDEFPVVQQHPPLGFSIEMGPYDMADELFPMPRYWFVATDDIYLIQVEKSAFIFNWRRRGTDKYPRFHKNIKPAFDKYYNLFDELIRAELGIPKISIDLCELTYVNSVEECDFWTGPQDTANVIPSFSALSPGADITEELGFSYQYGYRVATDMILSLRIQSVAPPPNLNVRKLVFEIKANGRLGQAAKSAADEWFKRAHDTVIGCFSGITSSDIQDKYWEPVGDAL